MLSPLGNLYRPAHRLGSACPSCNGGILYEQDTRFGGMVACRNYFALPRCNFRGSSVKVDNYRCGLSSCLLHHGSEGQKLAAVAQTFHQSSPPGSASPPQSGGQLPEGDSSYETLWDAEAIPGSLFPGKVKNGTRTRRIFSSYQPAQAPYQIQSAPCSVSNLWGAGRIAKLGKQNLPGKVRRKKQGRPQLVLSDG